MSEPVTLQEMAAGYATIVSPMDWARRCGERIGHVREDWGAVAEVIILGNLRLDPNTPALQGFRTICPTVTPTAAWIYTRTEHIGDDELYRRLYSCLEACPMGASSMDVERYAVVALRVVSRQIDMDGVASMRLHFATKGAGKNQGTDRAASSTAAKGEGKSQGKEKQCRPY